MATAPMKDDRMERAVAAKMKPKGDIYKRFDRAASKGNVKKMVRLMKKMPTYHKGDDTDRGA